MYGMSDYLMIAQAMEMARRLSRETTKDHLSRKKAGAGSSPRGIFTLWRRNPDE
jgi:hypothetical protein